MILLLACTSAKPDVEAEDSPEAESSAESTAPEETAESDDAPVDTSPDSPEDSPVDTETAPEESDPPPPEPLVRFVALGDGGEGNDTQYAVSRAIEAVCAAKTDDRPGCEFALYLGDNFYDDGVNGVDDEQFQSKFEDPYANLDFRFNVVLGNHDYGVLSLLEYKAEYEVEYTAYSKRWYLPDRYYSFEQAHVLFVGLDTNQIMLEDLWGDSGQADWARDLFDTTSASWKIVYGHHPYRSNGAHGNAGEYEGYEWLPIANGATIETFMEDVLCDRADVYFAGHDHNRQWLHPQCGMELVVSGAAAKTTDLEGRGNETWFEDDAVAGFFWVEIEGDTLRGEFYDQDGNLSFAQEVTR